MASTDRNEYVIIEPHPNEWSEDMRWIVTPGTKVVQHLGINAGTVGTIVGQARSRKADRLFHENLMRAAEAGRELTADDYGPLIDNEGPLVRMPNGNIEWFPGQATAILRQFTAEDAKIADTVDGDDDLADLEEALENLTVEVIAELLKNTLDKEAITAVIENLNEYLGQ
jgi:hypothetical protein